MFSFFLSPRVPKSQTAKLVQSSPRAPQSPAPPSLLAPSPAPGSRRSAVPEPRRCPRVSAPPSPSPVAAIPESHRRLREEPPSVSPGAIPNRMRRRPRVSTPPSPHAPPSPSPGAASRGGCSGLRNSFKATCQGWRGLECHQYLG
ncbi:hypothetical protein PVAP13_6KG099735 [Panicum virgatum]|uniref:Uncharacterized protein n=1 Tax=Panicum virgatum TaxID=38727 RepID=A0A8T0RAN3_PANVG|nr:hypothetical protein PVAP13_6KG099735 [Panicum virgatum]